MLSPRNTRVWPCALSSVTPPPPRSTPRRRSAPVRLPRWDHRRSRSRSAPRVLHAAGQDHEHRSRLLFGTDLIKDRGPAGRILRQWRQDNRRIQSQRAARAQSGARGRLRPGEIEHLARWNEDHRRIEMWLRSVEDQTVRVRDLDLEVSLVGGGDARRDQHQVLTRGSRGRAQRMWLRGRIIRRWWGPLNGDDFLMSLAGHVGPRAQSPSRSSSASSMARWKMGIGIDHVPEPWRSDLGMDGQA